MLSIGEGKHRVKFQILFTFAKIMKPKIPKKGKGDFSLWKQNMDRIKLTKINTAILISQTRSGCRSFLKAI